MNTLKQSLTGTETLSGVSLPVAGETITREAISHARRVDATLFVGTKATWDADSHEWNLITAIESHSQRGDHCAGYDKADRYGAANIWGRCIEVQDVSGKGAAWGLEVDVLTQPDAGRGDRWGIGLVLGKNPHAQASAYVDRGISIVPWEWKPESITVGVGVSVEVPARDAAIAVLPGERIAWDGAKGEVKSRFDPATGYWQLEFRGKPVLQVQVETGEMLLRGKRVVTE